MGCTSSSEVKEPPVTTPTTLPVNNTVNTNTIATAVEATEKLHIPHVTVPSVVSAVATAVVTAVHSGKHKVSNAGTTITLELDGCFVSFDKVRRQFIVTSKTGSVTTVGQIPARPNKPSATATVTTISDKGEKVTEPVKEAPIVAINKTGTAEKLGHKKVPISGAPSWQVRYFKLTGTVLTYYASENDPVAKGEISLSAGCVARVIQSNEPARKDRYEDNDVSVVGLMTQPMGAHLNLHSGPIGKPNCVELHVPAQIGNMLGSVMNATPMGLMAGGGIADINKNRARTYYWSCKTVEEANEWANALNNNVKLVKAPNAAAGQMLGNRINLGQIDAAMHLAHTIQADQKNMVNPDESLGWYERALKTNLSRDDLYAGISEFYDVLQASGLC